MLCQIVRTGGFDAPLGVAQSFPWNLPFLHRERAVLIENLVPDPLEIFPQMQTTRKGVSLIIDIQNSIKVQESKGYEHWA